MEAKGKRLVSVYSEIIDRSPRLLHSSRIQQRLELVDSIAKLLCAAEFADDFTYIPIAGNRRNFQHIGQGEVQLTIQGIFLQQRTQNGLRFRSQILEEFSLLLFDPVYNSNSIYRGFRPIS